MIINSFLELSKTDNTQIILTTHTPNLAKLLPTSSLRFITKENNNRVVKFNSDEIYTEIADSLGVLPEPLDSNTKWLLLVEGYYDIDIYRDISNKLKQLNAIPYSFDDLRIQIIFVGGCSTLNFWVNSSFAKSQNIPIVAYFDSDKLSESDTSKNYQKIQDLIQKGLITLGFCTQKRELENYLHPEIFKINDISITFGDFDDVKKIASEFYNNEMGEFTKPNKVLEKSWKKMTPEYFRERERYFDENGNEHFEFTENFLEIYKILGK